MHRKHKDMESLKKSVEQALVRKKLTQKQFIYECGCSRSHFNKVIRGERRAGVALQRRMTEVLELTEEEANHLFSTPDELFSEPEKPLQTEGINRKSNKPKITGKLKYFTIGILIVVPLSFLIKEQQNKILGEINSSPKVKSVKVDGDNSSFIKDITIPDGSTLKTNTHYTKIWRIKNTGKHVWHNRYFKRITPDSDLLCSSDHRALIADTQPQEFVDISIQFKTPHLPGSCRLDFKMVDKFGNLFFPNLHGVYLIVNVTS